MTYFYVRGGGGPAPFRSWGRSINPDTLASLRSIRPSDLKHARQAINQAIAIGKVDSR